MTAYDCWNHQTFLQIHGHEAILLTHEKRDTPPKIRILRNWKKRNPKKNENREKVKGKKRNKQSKTQGKRKKKRNRQIYTSKYEVYFKGKNTKESSRMETKTRGKRESKRRKKERNRKEKKSRN